MSIAAHPRRAEAIALLRQGRTPADVAQEIGAGQTTVRRWARAAGLLRAQGERGGDRAPRELGPLAQEAISRLGRGDQPAQIAKDLGVSAARIRQIRALVLDGEENNAA